MHRIIAWFLHNPVAANLLMWILLIGGLLSLPLIYQEEFPNMDLNNVSISVIYPGASPTEIEESVCIPIEQALEGVPGIESVEATAREGVCAVIVELQSDAPHRKVINEINSRIDTIDSFPKDAEEPIVNEVTLLANVLQIVISGKTDEHSLRYVGEEIKNDLMAIPGISQVTLNYVRPFEIAVEISEQTLRRYGITLQEVADSIRASSLDLPGGGIKTVAGEILLRTKAQAYTAQDFEEIVVLTTSDGGSITLGEIANVIDGFKDSELAAHLDGNPAIAVEIRRVGSEDILYIAEQVKHYIAKRQAELPKGIELTVWQDKSLDLIDRLRVLGKNAGSGLVLVLAVLALFLRLRLALWVAAGIPIAMLGSLMMFPAMGLSISTLSIMGFIVAMGILVDDAIVIGERIYAHEEKGKPALQAALDGTREVSVPVVFGVLTTIVTFLPIMTIPGDLSTFFSSLGITVLLCLVFSVIESQFILPSHLAHSPTHEREHSILQRWERIQNRVSGMMDYIAYKRYSPALHKALEWRYQTAAVAVCALILVCAMLLSGRIIFQFFPSADGERIYASLRMPEGTSLEVTEKAAHHIEASAELLRRELDANLPAGEPSRIKHILSSFSTNISKAAVENKSVIGSHFAEIALELDIDQETSEISPADIAGRWRELTGDIPGAVELSFSAAFFTAGKAIDIQLRGHDMEKLKKAAAMIRADLSRYDGVFDIGDSYRGGKLEIQLELLPEARNLGLTTQDLASQVRQAFYGEEVQRIHRGDSELKVMVRFPDDQRRSIGDLENMRIRTREGIEVPFAGVAKVSVTRGSSRIVRENGERTLNVYADVNRKITTPESVMSSVQQGVVQDITRQFPDITVKRDGEAAASDLAVSGLLRSAAIALLVIYTLLAIPLGSYFQPLVIMSAIPFGAVGAILGHYILGAPLVFFSMIGIVALSGVVVNASLVLVDAINRERHAGTKLHDAILLACAVRFRPIILTSLTTFVGLAPLISTANLATAIFVPLAISLAFGILFATSITLFLVPCVYLIFEDLSGLFKIAHKPDTESAS